MGYSAAATAKKHQHILDKSIRLFRQRGFSAVSVSQVMKAAGLTHGPFYNHFASKEALMSEALTREMELNTSQIASYPATEKGREKYVSEYLSRAHRDDCAGGCTVSALAAE